MADDLHFLGRQFLVLVVLCYTVHSMSLHWTFLVVVKRIDISRVTADYSSVRFEWLVNRTMPMARNFVQIGIAIYEEETI